MTTEADQDPLADVDPVPGEPQSVGATAEVGPDAQASLADLWVRRGQTGSGRAASRDP